MSYYLLFLIQFLSPLMCLYMNNCDTTVDKKANSDIIHNLITKAGKECMLSKVVSFPVILRPVIEVKKGE